MKNLSDYRIREENGKFVVEGRIEITERRFLRKFVNFEWHGLNVYGEVAGFCHQFDGSNVKIYTTLEDAKAQVIKWCEEPKYHYVVADYGINELHNFAIGKKRYKIQSVPKMDIPYLIGMAAIRRGKVMRFSCDKLPSFEDCGRKSLCTLSDEACKKYDALFLGNYAKCVSDEKGKLTEEYNVPNTPVDGKHFSVDDLKEAREQIILRLENLKNEIESLEKK